MSKSTEKYQQQILFDVADENSQNTDKNSLAINEQIIFDNEDWQDDESENIPDAFEQTQITPSKPRWLWRTLGVLFTSLIVIEAVDYFRVGFVEAPITTAIVAAITGCLSILAGATLFKELKGLRQFKQQQNIKTQAYQLLTESSEDGINSNINARELCQQISANLPTDIHLEQGENAEQWENVIQAEHNDKEILHLYSRTVLSQIDQKAINDIAKYSTESVVLVALSPVALIDMLIMLWRNIGMINKIAALYGLKLGYWSRIKLLKQVFMNMAYAGASEILTDVGADMLGADLLGKVSGRLAQGLGAGMLTARLGLRVLKLARPIGFNTPMLQQEQPKLGMIRKAVISQVTRLIKKES